VKRLRLRDIGAGLGGRFRPELTVIEFVATKKGDPERGPLVRINSAEARTRLVSDGELVWVDGPRRKEIAVLAIDDSMPAGKVALRDIAGVAVAESVSVVKPDLDTPAGGRQFG